MATFQGMNTKPFVTDNQYFCQAKDKELCILNDMDTYTDRLLWAMANTRPPTSQSDLARAIGVSPQSIQYLCDPLRNAQGSKYTSKIADYLNVKALWLQEGKGQREKTAAESGSIEDGPLIRGTVPLISSVQAGHWQEVIDNLSAGEGERIATTYRVREHTYALRVTGDSMEPKFPEGAILIVEPDETPDNGAYVIVRQNGSEAVFKQLVHEGEKRYLKPLNPRYPILELKSDAVFCGVVKRVEMDV